MRYVLYPVEAHELLAAVKTVSFLRGPTSGPLCTTWFCGKTESDSVSLYGDVDRLLQVSPMVSEGIPGRTCMSGSVWIRCEELSGLDRWTLPCELQFSWWLKACFS